MSRDYDLKSDLDNLLTELAVAGGDRKNPRVVELEVRIKRRYGDDIPMLMQAAGFRGDQSRQDVKGIDDEWSEYDASCQAANRAMIEDAAGKGRGKPKKSRGK